MGLFDWMETKIHHFSIMDFTVFKFALVIVGMIFGAFVADFVKEYVWYFIGAFVVLYGYLLTRIFKK